MCHGKGMEADTFSLIVHYMGEKVVEAGSWYLKFFFVWLPPVKTRLTLKL